MAQGIEVLDLAAFRAGGSPAADFTAALSSVCETAGVFCIGNHGFDDTLCVSLREQSKAIFSLDDAVKGQLAVTGEQHSGYIGDPAGFSERYRTHLNLDRDDPMVAAGVPLYGANVWPPAMPELEPVMTDCFDLMSTVSRSLLRALATVLEVDRDVFLPFFDNPLSTLTLMHSLPAGTTAEEREASPHSFPDSSAMTILLSDPKGGMEVRHRDGNWIEVPASQGTLTVVIGNMMEAWSGGRLASGSYRTGGSGAECHSMVFSAIPNYGTIIRPLPGFGDNYRPVHVGPYMEAFYRQQP